MEQHARQALGELRASVEEAAKGVLGDESQALRQAKADMERLLAEAGRERLENAQPGQGAQPGQAPGNPAKDPGGKGGQQPGNQPPQNPSPAAGASPEGGAPSDDPAAGGAGQDQRGQARNRPGGRPGEPSGSENPSPAAGGGPGGGFEGPITGDGFRGFTEGLRDVEDLLGIPQLRNRAAQVRDRARALRAEYKRDGKRPTGKLFESRSCPR